MYDKEPAFVDEKLMQSPHFNLKSHCFSSDMLEEFLLDLAKINNDLVENYSRFSVSVSYEALILNIFN